MGAFPHRIAGALRAVMVLLFVLTAVGCGTDDWDPDAQFAPSLRPVFGARVTGGELSLWTGSPCIDVTRLALVFDIATPDSARTVLVSEQGAPVERFTLTTPPEGLTVQEPLPEDFDWRTAESLTLVIDGPPDAWGSRTDLAEVRDGSSDHAEDTYYFSNIGWLDADQVAAGDQRDFITTCTRDPGGS